MPSQGGRQDILPGDPIIGMGLGIGHAPAQFLALRFAEKAARRNCRDNVVPQPADEVQLFLNGQTTF